MSAISTLKKIRKRIMAQDSLPSPIYVIRQPVIIYKFTETILIVLVDKYLTRPTMPLV